MDLTTNVFLRIFCEWLKVTCKWLPSTPKFFVSSLLLVTPLKHSFFWWLLWSTPSSGDSSEALLLLVTPLKHSLIRLQGFCKFSHSHFFQNVCDLLFDHARTLNSQFSNPPHLSSIFCPPAPPPSSLPNVLPTSKTKFKSKLSWDKPKTWQWKPSLW